MKKVMLSLSLLIVAGMLLAINVCAESFVVKKGDNFWKLAKKHDVSWYSLMALNSDKLVHAGNFDLIYPGQVFDLPIKIENVDVLTKDNYPEPTTIEAISIETSEVSPMVSAEPEKPVVVTKSEFPAEVYSINGDKLLLMIAVDAKDGSLFIGENRMAAFIESGSVQQLTTPTELVVWEPPSIKKRLNNDCADFFSATLISKNLRMPIVTKELNCEEYSILKEFLTRKKSTDEPVGKQLKESTQTPALSNPEVSWQLVAAPSRPTSDSALTEPAQAETPKTTEQSVMPSVQAEIAPTQALQAEPVVDSLEILQKEKDESVQAISNEQPLNIENSLPTKEKKNTMENCDGVSSVIIISEYPFRKTIKADNITCEDVRMLEKFLMKGDKLVILNE